MRLINKNIKSFTVLFISMLLLTTVIFLITSCAKDDSVPAVENVIIGDGLKVVSYSYHKKGVSGKGLTQTAIAVFENQKAYENYALSLETQVEAWDDAFVAKWGHLNDEDLNAKEEELNFDSEKPLTDFENSTGIQSLRQQYLAAEEVWLSDDVLNEDLDPDNNTIYNFDENEMALINSIGEVKIGDKITKQLNDEQIRAINEMNQQKGGLKQRVPLEEGAYLEINDGDFNTLIDFNEGDVSVVDNDNVNVVTESTSIDCKYNKKKVKYYKLSSTRKIKTKVKVGQPTYNNGNVKAKIVSLKKRKHRSGWKRYRTILTVGLIGNVSDTHCDGYTEYLNKIRKPRKKRRYKLKYHNPNFQSHVVENGGMKGVYSQNGVTRELILTW